VATCADHCLIKVKPGKLLLIVSVCVSLSFYFLFCSFLLARHRAALDVYVEAQKMSPDDWVISNCYFPFILRSLQSVVCIAFHLISLWSVVGHFDRPLILQGSVCVSLQGIGLKGEVSSKMTYIFNWPLRISIFLENFL